MLKKILILIFTWGAVFSTLAQSPDNDWESLIQKVVELNQKGQNEEAISYAKKAIIAARKEFSEEHPYFAVSLVNLAMLYKGMRRYTEAESLYAQATEILKAQLGEDHPDYAFSLHNLAGLYESMGRYTEAEVHYKQSTKINKAQFGEKHPAYAGSLLGLAGLFQSMGRYAKAEPLYNQALEIYKTQLGEEHLYYATPLDNLASLYQRMGRYDDAEQLYTQAMKILKTQLGEEHPIYAGSLRNLASLYQRMSRYAESEQLYMQAMGIQRAQLGQNHPDYATSLEGLVELLLELGRYTEAELLISNKMGIVKAQQPGEDHPNYTSSLNILAVLYSRMGRYAEAEPLYVQAMRITKAQLGEDNPIYATFMDNLGLLYTKMGRYDKAEQLMRRATEIRKAQLVENHPDYATSLNNLAGLYQSLGRYAEAEPLYTQAMEIRKKQIGEEHPDYAGSLNNLASLYQDMGRYDKAEPLSVETIGLLKAQLGENHPYYAGSLIGLAALYKSMGRNKETEQLYLEAIGVLKAQLGEKHTYYAASLTSLAGLYRSIGRYDKAEPLYVEAIGVLKAQLGEKHPYYARSLFGLAALNSIIGRQALAETLLLQGQEVYLHQLRSVFPNFSEKEKEQFLNTCNQYFEFFHSFALKGREQNSAITATQYDNALMLKGLLLQSSSQTRERILASGDTTAIRLFGDWQALKRQWLRESEIPKSERDQAGIAPEATLAKANTLEKELSRRSEAFAEAIDTVRTTWREVKRQLQPLEAAIELVRYTWHNKNWTDTVHYAAIIVTPETEGHPHLVVLENGNELEERGAQSYQSAFATRGASRVADGDNPIPADSLYAYFWQPIQQALDSLGGTGKVYLSADGVYHTLNLQTLKNPETGQYLLETLDIERVGSTRDLVKKKKQHPNNNNAILAGYPSYPASPDAVASALQRYQQGRAAPVLTASRSSINYGSYQTYRAIDANRNDITPLPGTLVEVEQLASILDGEGIDSQALLEHAASEDVLKKVKSPRILHIATHGFFERESEQTAEGLNGEMLMSGLERETITENPYLRCGLYLAGAETTLRNRGNPDFQRPEGQEDGILTAYEATLLDLRGTELVVLSACETGLGVTKNGEGVYGLQRAFQVAGAETVIFSLWKVADEQTQEMMGLFYQNWLQKDKTKRQAFKAAQLTINEKYEDPYYWGAFVMIGGKRHQFIK
ncbi:CHAT domain-containing tetratricopeptide repeat protein [Cyclobacterium plantarum]|uniref:CHAT domain-containing protein n=1 Tax=Cyclobacterium plantarum TaxID=2716263 RepID=A0ABX0HFP8_9BACT|nr:CHAT domain-containing protein [Cyclobacterium plantarum]NHE58972.1 CHAT domain-containing protein [Cyclobacterium plantarum]